MSAIEVINEVRELPVKEQEQVLDFLQKDAASAQACRQRREACR